MPSCRPAYGPVPTNGNLGHEAWKLRAMAGTPKLEKAQPVQELDHVDDGDAPGLKDVCAAAPKQVGPAWDEALGAGRPPARSTSWSTRPRRHCRHT